MKMIREFFDERLFHSLLNKPKINKHRIINRPTFTIDTHQLNANTTSKMEQPIIQFSPHKQQHPDVNITATPTNPLSKLNDDARVLNGGIIGRHSVKCNFRR